MGQRLQCNAMHNVGLERVPQVWVALDALRVLDGGCRVDGAEDDSGHKGEDEGERRLAISVAAPRFGVVLPEQQQIHGRAETLVRVRVWVRVRGRVRVGVRFGVWSKDKGWGFSTMTIVPETVVAERASVLLSRLRVPTTASARMARRPMAMLSGVTLGLSASIGPRRTPRVSPGRWR